MTKLAWCIAFLSTLALSNATPCAAFEGDATFENFAFASGESLPQLRIHYRAYGRLERGPGGRVRNAVLVLHGTTGSGAQFMQASFAGELFGPGQPLDTTRFYVVLPDGIGHGRSSKPSDGLHARFPRYRYADMVEAQHRLLTQALGVDHLRLVVGTSMGGMHAWLWGERYPEFMDALLPLASLPVQIAGRNRAWRRLVIDAIRNDPAWRDGQYSKQPPSLRTAAGMLWLMSSNPVIRQRQAPSLAKADSAIDTFAERYLETSDANDVLYALEASGDYDPAPNLGSIRAPLFAINFADDLINPPELGILEREIGKVPKGRALIIPRTDQSVGHGTHTVAAVWKQHLERLLRESAGPAAPH
jgi:homoserine O-acetyltransferase